MYHHHSQQGSQPFPNGPRPPHRQPPPNQHQNRPDVMSQVMGFQFPRPTQLPDELESALAIRGARDVDHRVIDHLSQSNQHQNPGSGSGIGQHGSYSSGPAPLMSDNQPGHQQGVDWSSYQPATKGFVSPQSTASHLPQQHQGPPQQPQSSHTGTSNPTWSAPLSDSPSPQAQHPHGVGGDGQGLYTPESAGSILASFGLSNEDLEVLSHYPDDQLTPDTLPFILRDIQINKSGNQKTMASTSAPSFSRIVHDMPARSSPLAHLHAPEVPSLLTVTQTAGKVIDYGHASRSKDENNEKETFKREQLSSERTDKMYPSPHSSSTPKANKAERRHGHLEPTASSKHGDQDYRRINREHRKSNRSPGREFPPSSKSRNLDRDYRHNAPKPRPSPEARSEASSRWSRSSSSGSKSHSSSKTLPTPTMISDFSAASPKVYPHTCSLCHIPCDQEKDWVDHVNTVNHTAACRDLRNKYPDWKTDLPSRSGQHDHRPAWHPKDRSPSHSVSRSLSGSPPPSPHSTHRVGPHRCRPHGRSFSPYHHHRYQDFTGGSSRSGVKRPHDDPTRSSSDTSPHPPSSKVGHSSKHGPIQSSAKTVKNVTKSGSKTNKTTCAKAADISAKPSPAKKKKKIATPTPQDSSHADRLVYLTGIPNDASEQEVTDMVRSVGKINNVILMPSSEEESEKATGQKASVCMLTAGHAQALANATNLSIRGQQITASVAKKPGSGQSSDANNSKCSPGQEKGASGEDSAGEAEGKTSDQKGVVLITGLPESGWSESDIISLVQPFGTHCDIILAKQIGKVLVSVSDIEIAQEMVKINSFKPMKIHDCELKMMLVKQHVGFTTPVALYNFLMGSVDPLESSLPVGWGSLVVISNVPDTLTGSSEVQKLVRRFGTVIKTLVLNSVVICEMATAAMALSVYKRFQRFPCIIHNNPLIFSRKPDPKANIQSKVISAYLDSSEDTPTNGKGQKMSAAEDEEQMAHKTNAESSLEGTGQASDGKNEEMKNTEKMDCSEDEALEQQGCEDKKDGLAAASDASASPHAEADLETGVRETTENATEMAEERDVAASPAEDDMTPAGEASHSGDKAASPERALPELPKVTHEMVKALLVECRTRTASHPDDAAASPTIEHEETQMEMDQGEKPVEETEGPAKNDTVEEEMKNQDRKLRDARERERRARERERWDRARREREREREKREEERRQWMRRERERRERKRAYSDAWRPRSAPRLDQHKQSWRGEKVKVQPRAEEQEQEEEEEEFPFNMSDFVTVDEVGDVSDLPDPPSPSVPTEATEEDALAAVAEDAQGDASLEVAPETTSDAAAVSLTCDEHKPEPDALATDETSDAGVSPDLMFTAAAASPAAVCQPGSDPSQSQEPACQPEAPGTDDSSNSPTRRALTSESGEENKDLAHSQSEEAVVPDGAEEDEKTQDEEAKETGAPAVGMGKRSEDQTHSEEASEKDEVKMEAPLSAGHSLPPFDPSSPVGMEFLVPKTGFLCKPCNRFFTGSREAEISHCKTLKHYDSLQKYLQTGNMGNATNAATSS